MNAEARCARALQKIQEDVALHAWSFVDASGALNAARESDQRYISGRALGPLDGQLVALKANIAVRDWPWDAGTLALRERIATADAPLVASLRAAGAVMLGLTRMDEAALGASGVSIDGPIGLPHDRRFSPGGSSGGAAVAVAAGHCDVAIGTDTLGSIRIPAALCGLAGLKPHRHSLSLDGIEPLHPDFDQPGPIAGSWRSLIAVCQAIMPTTRSMPNFRSADRTVHILGLPESTLAALSPEVRAGYCDEIGVLEDRGLSIHRPDGHSALTRVYEGLDQLGRARLAAFALCERELARHWCIPKEEAGAAKFVEDLAISSQLKSALRYGATLSADKVLTFEMALQNFKKIWSELNARMQQELHGSVIWLLPTLPVARFQHTNGAPTDLADWTALASITGWAALTLPSYGFPPPDPMSHEPCASQDPITSSATTRPRRPQAKGIALQWVSADLDNQSLCETVLEVTSNLLAGGDPNAFSPTDVQ